MEIVSAPLAIGVAPTVPRGFQRACARQDRIVPAKRYNPALRIAAAHPAAAARLYPTRSRRRWMPVGLGTR